MEQHNVKNDTLEHAQARDAADPLAHFRERFAWPHDEQGRRKVYLCGNSLGLQPHRAAEYVAEVMHDWATLGVEGHFRAERAWVPYNRAASPLMAELIGCHADEVAAMNTLTINLNLLMLSFYRPADSRWKILIEADAFPSDRYAVQSQLDFHGRDVASGIVEWHAGENGLEMAELERLLAANDDIALILLPGVQYLSGEVLDMAGIAELARRHQVPLGLDLAHAIGNVPIRLDEWQVDFAVFCTYKYLNGGPGAIGGAYVNRRHHDSDVPRLHGWWGNDEASRFKMRKQFEPAPGIEAWQQSNAPVLSLAPVIAGLELFHEAGLEALREKSQALTGYLRTLLEQHFASEIGIITPAASDRQGCQLSLVVKTEQPAGREVFERLDADGVTCDWREPNAIRIAPAPIYNNFEDVWQFTQRLRKALDGT